LEILPLPFSVLSSDFVFKLLPMFSWIAEQSPFVVCSHVMTSHRKTTSRTKGVRNPAEYPVLGILMESPLHGYETCRRLTEGIGSVWRLGKSQIYALLDRLEHEGLVIHERVGQENLPAKNIFSLTNEGVEVVKGWIEQPVYHIRDMRLEFFTKLWFARQASAVQEGHLLGKQLEVCRLKAADLARLQHSCGNEVEGLSIAFRLTLIKATISWLEDLLDLTDPQNSKMRKNKEGKE
jgi:DNA-binding PadR family transcriptional regulator